MIERVARILAWTNDFPPSGPDIHGWTDKHWQEWEWQARAVIAAMREPAEAMLEAAEDKVWPDKTALAAWAAMIDAALS